ncbi:MAG: rod shape-determining protein RodA [Blautia sp.]|nr:rod shape-determining protein RodA [Blautia sp.]
MLKQYKLRNYHFQLIIFVVILTVIGIMLIGSAEPSSQKKQVIGMGLGLVLMVIVSLIDYSFILKFRWLYYVAILGLLAYVLFAGPVRGGARRWIELPVFNLQPSELAKLVMILFFAAYFMKREENINSLKTLIPAFVIAAAPLVLILKEPDTSTTILTALIFVTLLFIGGLSYKIVLAVLGISIPVGVIGISYILRLAQAETDSDYRFGRIMSWLYPTDPRWSDNAAQQQNSIMAIGSGQLWGKGLNNSVATSMKNANYIIEPQTDFIFAVAGEELGFVGTLTIIVLLFLIVLECILIARKAKDMAGRLICCGMAALVGFQSFINICVATGFMPNTGIPLPFVSYGLSSLVTLFIGMGFVLNVGLQPKKY